MARRAGHADDVGHHHTLDPDQNRPYRIGPQDKDELRATEEELRLSLAPKPPAGSVEQTVLSVERRQLLRELPDDLGRMDVLREALISGDQLTVTAFETAPPFAPLVDPADMRKAIEDQQVKNSPATADRLQQTARLRVALDTAINGAMRAIPAVAEDHFVME